MVGDRHGEFWVLRSLESEGLVTTRPGRGEVFTWLDPTMRRRWPGWW